MKIRRAHQSDIPQILPMIAKVCALHESWDSAKYGFLPQPERLYENWLGDLIRKSKHLCLVAEAADSSKLVAFLIATVEKEIPIYRLKQFGFVHDLWVEPEHRHAGIARQMVMQMIEHFTHQGIEQIRLDTAMANDTARKLFESCGFRASTIEMLIEFNASS